MIRLRRILAAVVAAQFALVTFALAAVLFCIIRGIVDGWAVLAFLAVVALLGAVFWDERLRAALATQGVRA